MSGDPQEDFEREWFDEGWRASSGETIAQAAAVVCVGLPLLAVFEVAQLVKRAARWARRWPMPEGIGDLTEEEKPCPRRASAV